MLNMYVLYDKVEELSGPVLLLHTDIAAIRAAKSALATRPDRDDYVLYNIGVIDERKGKIVEYGTSVVDISFDEPEAVPSSDNDSLVDDIKSIKDTVKSPF